MKTYKELIEVYNKRIDTHSDNLPINTFDIAASLNIRVKNSFQAKKDWKNNTPLNRCNACLSLFNGEYIIYHDEKYPYKNFAVAHEIAHYLLGHATDGIEHHHDAQLLAAIIVAPPELLKKSSIKSVIELAEQCKIPIDVAEEYWTEIKAELGVLHLNSSYLKHALFAVILAILCFSGGFITSNKIALKTAQNTPSDTPAFLADNITSQEQVYITKTGDKYHKSGCQYIEGHDTAAVSLTEAEDLGYEPCKVCIN